MKYLVLLFVFIFSPVALSVSGHIGKMEIAKLESITNVVVPKTVKEEAVSDSLAIAIKTLSDWQFASGSYYDPKDTLQTRKGGDGKGAFDRMIQSGSIALGSSFTKFFQEERENMKVFFEVKLYGVRDSIIVTQFGTGIFRLDDLKPKSKSFKKHNYSLDFNQEDLTKKMKQIGRFRVMFRIHRIES